MTVAQAASGVVVRIPGVEAVVEVVGIGIVESLVVVGVVADVVISFSFSVMMVGAGRAS